MKITKNKNKNIVDEKTTIAPKPTVYSDFTKDIRWQNIFKI